MSIRIQMSIQIIHLSMKKLISYGGMSLGFSNDTVILVLICQL